MTWNFSAANANNPLAFQASGGVAERSMATDCKSTVYPYISKAVPRKSAEIPVGKPPQSCGHLELFAVLPPDSKSPLPSRSNPQNRYREPVSGAQFALGIGVGENGIGHESSKVGMA